jgi:hypothetical protein
MRSPPLWGVRTRTELLHHGRSATFYEAEAVTNKFNRLTPAQQTQLNTFLPSL